MEKGEPCRLFGTFLGSLGAVRSLLGHFLKPLGHLGHQKSPEGGPKAPKRPRRNPQIAAPGPRSHLFGSFFGSLGAVGSLLGHFLEPLGNLGHQKSPKGGPKAPKGFPKVSQKGAFFGVVCITRIPKKCKKTAPKSTTANVPQV